jgi:hypothetical protein
VKSILKTGSKFSFMLVSVNTVGPRYNEIVTCTKSATKAAVPTKHVYSGPRKPLWNRHPEVKRVKNRAKFWLQVWNACNRPSSGSLFTAKQKIAVRGNLFKDMSTDFLKDFCDSSIPYPMTALLHHDSPGKIPFFGYDCWLGYDYWLVWV